MYIYIYIYIYIYVCIYIFIYVYTWFWLPRGHHAACGSYPASLSPCKVPGTWRLWVYHLAKVHQQSFGQSLFLSRRAPSWYGQRLSSLHCSLRYTRVCVQLCRLLSDIPSSSTKYSCIAYIAGELVEEGGGWDVKVTHTLGLIYRVNFYLSYVSCNWHMFQQPHAPRACSTCNKGCPF